LAYFLDQKKTGKPVFDENSYFENKALLTELRKMNLYEGLDIDFNDEAFVMKTRIMQKNIEQSIVWRSLKEQR
jgi:hypothetical protein